MLPPDASASFTHPFHLDLDLTLGPLQQNLGLPDRTAILAEVQVFGH